MPTPIAEKPISRPLPTLVSEKHGHEPKQLKMLPMPTLGTVISLSTSLKPSIKPGYQNLDAMVDVWECSACQKWMRIEHVCLKCSRTLHLESVAKQKKQTELVTKMTCLNLL